MNSALASAVELCEQPDAKPDGDADTLKNMNIETGELGRAETVAKMTETERGKFVPVKRDLSKVELLNAQIMLYSPCGCGSGRKFKFCCHVSNGGRSTQPIQPDAKPDRDADALK